MGLTLCPSSCTHTLCAGQVLWAQGRRNSLPEMVAGVGYPRGLGVREGCFGAIVNENDNFQRYDFIVVTSGRSISSLVVMSRCFCKHSESFLISCDHTSSGFIEGTW
ncbi:hypothetical protein Zmor_009216 [Zophobas morio]|uniref:Uncharacterized protein n=1 Tax=Zophobas morio TaxID=2755281 RepID=A0AA38IM55_9CUCU|nr:hypothetical protein Zmor_009216 [Zophobas morio]